MFGPPIPPEAVFKKSKEFSDFLLAKSKYLLSIFVQNYVL